jgi:predicted Ser/Thr protein kinase
MTSPRSPEEIFSDAIELSPADRTRFLDAECGTDARLRDEVESLLQIADGDPALLDFPNRESGEESIPEAIGRYRILERCGSGGMGVVYKGQDPVLRRMVAIKVLPSGSGTATVDARRLESEARYLATLNHPNVATIYALEYDNDVPFLAMEFVAGRTLKELLRAGSLTGKELLRICIDIAAGLGAAHERGIIHRDLKPANVMVSGTGVSKLLDFGIAKDIARPAAEPGTRGGQGVAGPGDTTGIGTPAYMSPEQQLGLAADQRSDIWAFGMLLRECFSTNPQGLPERTRKRLERLSAWCLQQAPDERPASIEVVRKEIIKAQAELVRGRSARLLVAGASVVLIAVSIVAVTRFVVSRRAVPVSVRAHEHSLEGHFSDGSRRDLLPPTWMTDRIDSAFVATRSDGAHLVVGWTKEGTERGGTLLFWNRRGRLLRALGATEENPFAAPGQTNSAMYGRKQFTFVSTGHGSGQTIDVVEYSHYFPSVFRRFEWDDANVREIYRLYHAGNIAPILYSPGLEAGSELMWLSGRIRDGGALRKSVGGVSGNTYFVACFDAKAVGTEVYPGFDSPTLQLAAGAPGAPRIGQPVLYFVLRGYAVVDDRIAWESPGAMTIIDVMRNDDGGLAVLLINTLRFDIDSAADGSTRVALSLGSEGERIMEARARRLRKKTWEVTEAFLADSVVTLVDARPGLAVTGDFRDMRGKIGE